MLPGQHRITRSDEFTRVVRRGTRVKRPTLVVHLMLDGSADDPPRAGFVVSRAVGNAVVRHRVTRRLRHAVHDRLADLPRGSLLVVRALPSAATAEGDLVDDLANGLASAVRRGSRR